MRVFNIYMFNIADKVKFKDAQSYIQNMLSELGLGWSDLAFAASTVSGDRTISNVLEKLRNLKSTSNQQKTDRLYAATRKTGYPGRSSPTNRTMTISSQCFQKYRALLIFRSGTSYSVA